MRVLIIHHEAEYFSGAEKMLFYFLSQQEKMGLDIQVVGVANSKAMAVIPSSVTQIPICQNSKFSLLAFKKQVQECVSIRTRFPFDIIHAWAARDWELASMVGLLTRRPVVGTLHDHPNAFFISRFRQLLMRFLANRMMRCVCCVSQAVRNACVEYGYKVNHLCVIRNGLQIHSQVHRKSIDKKCVRIGFLGGFNVRKGFDGFFEILRQLSLSKQDGWEAYIAGGATVAGDQEWVERVLKRYNAASWWPRIHFIGWVDDPFKYLQDIDVLIVPSATFDPFPTVLLEAGIAGVPVLASDVGGVSEIIQDGKTGWLFPGNRLALAGQILASLLLNPEEIEKIGRNARQYVTSKFALAKMFAEYRTLYSNVTQE